MAFSYHDIHKDFSADEKRENQIDYVLIDKTWH
jgi:hypothetical protein